MNIVNENSVKVVIHMELLFNVLSAITVLFSILMLIARKNWFYGVIAFLAFNPANIMMILIGYAVFFIIEWILMELKAHIEFTKKWYGKDYTFTKLLPGPFQKFFSKA